MKLSKFRTSKERTAALTGKPLIKGVATGIVGVLGLGALFYAGQGIQPGEPQTVNPFRMVFMDRAMGETAVDASAKACYAEIARTEPKQTGDLLKGAETPIEGVAANRCIRETQGVLYTIGDLDGDGLADVVSLSKGGKLTMGWNTGWGFRNVVLPPMGSAAGNSGQLLSGFLNADEHADIALISTEGTVTVAFGKGGRSFGTPEELAKFPISNAVTLADLDGDGHQDLLTAPPGPGVLQMIPGGPNGPRGTLQTLFSTGTAGISVMRPADLDGDGDLDLITAGTGGMRVWGNDKGRWSDMTPGTAEDTRWVRDAAVVDINGDGELDLLTTGVKPGYPAKNDSSYRMLWLRDGDIYRAELTSEVLSSSWGRSMTATDLNLDARTDAVVAAGAPATSKLDASWPGAFTKTGVLLGTGSGAGFVDGFPQLFRALHFYASMSMVASADFDGDTRPDLFLSGEENAAPYVYLNRSVGDSALVSWEKPSPGDRLVVRSGGKQISYVAGGTSAGLHLGPLPVAVGLPGSSGQLQLHHGSLRLGYAVRAGDHVRITTS